MIQSLFAAITLLMTPEAPLLQDPVPESVDPDYAACVTTVGEDAAAGRLRAERWANEGGGPPAQHCLAVAELAAGLPKLAAIRLQELAERNDAGDDLVRARILSQAALAWVEAGEIAQAEETMRAAFAVAPNAGELYLAQAKIHAAAGRNQAAIDAVDRAEEDGFVSADASVLRGRAKHNLLRHREAADDVIAALSLDPMNVDALVLRGDLIQAGVTIGARYRRDESN